MNPEHDWLAADWPAPTHIRAGCTRRSGGTSQDGYAALNLGAHVGDDPARVAANRQRLVAGLDLPSEPVWLSQVHGIAVADLDDNPSRAEPADAAVATRPERVVGILTADCLPVLLCDRHGRCWAGAHAGWRGLAAGVLEATVARMPARPADLLAWFGPAIGADRFEVGAEVRAAFVDHHSDDHVAFREARRPGKFRADIVALATARLRRVGVTAVYGGGPCTIADTAYYSYRRDGEQTGRMASLIWSAPA